MLVTRGREVIDEHGERVLLRGYNLSTWLMMENFMLGTPGVEQQFRRYLTRFAGAEKAEWFFELFLDTFVQEKDIIFIKEE